MPDLRPEGIQDGVAVLAMACRLPGAAGVEQLWANLAAGAESITFFSPAEVVATGRVPRALAEDPHYVGAKGVLAHPDRFDAELFGLTPGAAERMDPQHRILLECAWEALEVAGYGAPEQSCPVGVFAGCDVSEYCPPAVDVEGIVAGGHDFLATRISYKLNLQGPSYTVQTACSTSLVAVHLAVKSLLDGECDMALAGGVCLRPPQERGYLYQEGGIYSPDGHCRPFDVDARGTVGGNGAGIVVLKRLEDALADGDAMHAVLLASAVNNDGASKVGYAAPSVEGQARCIREALALARVDAASIAYVEAHGTGTPVGDPIEVAALNQAFGLGPASRGTCALGALKSSVGHLGAAAGVAGLIKAILALDREAIPPSPYFRRPNPRVDFAGGPFYVNPRLVPWPRGGSARRAGVSSFGVGGTNAHVILEEAPPPAPPRAPARPWHLLPLSAQSEAALVAATERLAEFLETHLELDLADVAYTLQLGRRRFPHRRFAVCAELNGAAAALRGAALRRCDEGRPAVAFLFPGQGALAAGMGRELYQREAVFRHEIDHGCGLLQAVCGFDPRLALFAAPDGDTTRRLATTSIEQPILFLLEHALARLWMAWGIEPAALLGHSVGEYTAACLAGVFSFPDALRLVAARGALMEGLPPGAMLAVAMPEEEAQDLLGPGLSLAAVNAPGRVVVAGAVEVIEALARRLRAGAVGCRQLSAQHAFHSADVEPILGQFAAQVRAVPRSAPQVPMLSNVTGTWITAAEATDTEYWVRHMRQTVRFAAGVRQLAEDPNRFWLEAGPGETLSLLVRQTLSPSQGGGRVAASLPAARGKAEIAALLAAAGQLWAQGARLNWPALHDGKRHRVHLPPYPFQRRSYWLRRAPVALDGPPVPETAAVACDTGQEAAATEIAQRDCSVVVHQLAVLARQLDLLEERAKEGRPTAPTYGQ